MAHRNRVYLLKWWFSLCLSLPIAPAETWGWWILSENHLSFTQHITNTFYELHSQKVEKYRKWWGVFIEVLLDPCISIWTSPEKFADLTDFETFRPPTKPYSNSGSLPFKDRSKMGMRGPSTLSAWLWGTTLCKILMHTMVAVRLSITWELPGQLDSMLKPWKKMMISYIITWWLSTSNC